MWLIGPLPPSSMHGHAHDARFDAFSCLSLLFLLFFLS